MRRYKRTTVDAALAGFGIAALMGITTLANAHPLDTTEEEKFAAAHSGEHTHGPNDAPHTHEAPNADPAAPAAPAVDPAAPTAPEAPADPATPAAPATPPVIDKPKTEWIGSPNFDEQNGVKPQFYVIHWMVGHLAGTDRAFQNPSYEVATHYGIEGNELHQYVEEGDKAWGNGHPHANKFGISVEHAGGWTQPDGSLAKPSPETHATSARLLAHLSQKYGWGELKKGVNVFEHNDFSATACPGSTDVEGIIAEANRILKEG
jgi:hypothetical protein